MHKFKIKQISLAIWFVLLPFAADAAGLGKLNVISGLGEPLRAEIELLSTTPEEMSSLTAAIAPEEAYAVQGIERSALQGTIKIEVGKKAGGTPILKLSTNQAISDPFLDMLIQVDWSTGRLLREYTVLLDPPGYTEQTSDPAVRNAVSGRSSTKKSSSPVQSADTVEKKVKSAGARNNRKTAKSFAAAPAEAAFRQDTAAAENVNPEDHTTVRGDTLSTIAAQLPVEGVSLEQLLVGLYRANQDAFAGGNMNRLKVGQIIHAPTAEELQSVSRKDAAIEIRAQARNWNAYRNKLAGIVAASPDSQDEAGNQSTGGRITASAEDKAAPAATGPRDVVKLSKSDTTAAAKNTTGDTKAMQDKLNSLQEEVTARENSVKEANDRTAALEKQIADMQKLLTVKNQAMADLQKSAAAQPATPVPEAAKPATSNAVAAKPVETAKPAEPVKPAEAPKQVVVAEADKPVAATPAAVATPEAGVADVSKANQVNGRKKIVTTPSAPIETGFFDGLLQDPLLLQIAGGALVLLGAAWLFLRNRRKRGLDNFEQSILTAGGLKANTVFGNTASNTLDTGDTSFLTDFSQSSSGGMIDTHDVDPIAEAEVYMAYGRDAQAEEILKHAIAKEPKRYELHLKLLEIYAERNDSSGFETIAGELYSTLGSADPIWTKVAAMGHKREPDNPLYESTTAHAGSHAISSAPATIHKLTASDFAEAEAISGSDLDFSLDANAPSDAAFETAPVLDDNSVLDFDLGTAEEAPLAAELSANDAPVDSQLFTAGEELSEPLESNDLDFLLDMPKPAPDNRADAHTTAAEDKTDADLLNGDTVQLDISHFEHTLPGLEIQEPEVRPTSPSEHTVATLLDSGADAVFSPSEINFYLPDSAEPHESATVSELTSTPVEPIITQPIATQSDNDSEEIIFDMTAEQADSPDLNFDLDRNEAQTITQPVVKDNNSKPADFDLSDISFDFDSTPGMLVEEVDMSSGESPDVETKLDLVTAYMDMGDSEGARELLDEVLKEGGSHQRERAQQMLNNLG